MRPTFTLTPPRSLDSGDVAGFLGGLVAYALFVSYIRYGPGGPTGWFKAKFFNEPYWAAVDSADAAHNKTIPDVPGTSPNDPINANPLTKLLGKTSQNFGGTVK